MSSPVHVRPDIRAEDGFTLIEVVAATVILAVGLVGLFTMTNALQLSSQGTAARDQAVAVQREVLEAARTIPPVELRPTSVAGRVRALPELADDSPEPGWQLERRGIEFTIALGTCTVDDPRDGAGARDAASFCANGAGTTSPQTCRTLLGTDGDIAGTPAAGAAGAAAGDCGIDADYDGTVDDLVGGPSTATADRTPDDYRRIVALVRWRRGPGVRYVLQSTTVASGTNTTGVRVMSLTPVDPVITAPTATVQSFTAVTDRLATTLNWRLDGAAQIDGASGSGTSWTLALPLGGPVNTTPGAVRAVGELLDGVYAVSARAGDADGIFGESRAVSLLLNRRVPYAVAGQDLRFDGSVLVAWTAAPEGDLRGYRLLRQDAAGAEPILVCETRALACRDEAPPVGTDVRYWVVALDSDLGGQPREGDAPATRLSVDTTNDRPAPPADLAVGSAPGNPTHNVLTWRTGSDPDGIAGHRIYRDGTGIKDRFATVDAPADAWTDTATADGLPHRYWISAVDPRGGESELIGPVER